MKCIYIKKHSRRFFKSYQIAKEFCAQVDGSLHYKGSATYERELDFVEYPEDYEDFGYVVIWEIQ